MGTALRAPVPAPGGTITGSSEAVTALSPFVERLRALGLGETVVLHTGRRSSAGRLRQVDAVTVHLDAESDEFDERCHLEVSAERIEAFEISGT